MYDKIFKRAMAVGVALEAIGIFGHHMVLAEVAIVALCTTTILSWFVLNKEEDIKRSHLERRKSHGYKSRV